MTKSTASGVWLVGLLIAVAGIASMIAGVTIGARSLSSATVQVQNVQDLRSLINAYAGTPGIVLIVLGLLAVAAGGLLTFVGWVLALIASGTIERWGWFVVLLVLGLLSLTLPVMLAYVLFAPSRRPYEPDAHYQVPPPPPGVPPAYPPLQA
jgi:hypothetical protein